MHSMGNSITRQQYMQQYNKNHIQTHTATKRILIVNSEDDVNLALKLALEEEEGRSYFKVDSFNNPILALKDFKNGSYDLLIIDISMPQMNGFELSEKIRNIDDKVKICFLTAGGVPSKVRFDPFIGKGSPPPHHTVLYEDKFIRLPIENKELVSRVEGMIDS